MAEKKIYDRFTATAWFLTGALANGFSTGYGRENLEKDLRRWFLDNQKPYKLVECGKCNHEVEAGVVYEDDEDELIPEHYYCPNCHQSYADPGFKGRIYSNDDNDDRYNY